MKHIELLLVAGLLAPALVARQEPGKQDPDPAQEPPKKPKSAVTRFFREQTERLQSGLVGSWLLVSYDDPAQRMEEGAAHGYAQFLDGLAAIIISVDTYDRRLFRFSEFTLLQTGAYRYRVDAQGNLQLVNVISYSNQTEDGELVQEPSNLVSEYFATLQNGLLELRDLDGVVITFQKTTAGDFPDSAIRKLESQRAGQARWETWEDLQKEAEQPR